MALARDAWKFDANLAAAERHIGLAVRQIGEFIQR